MGERALEDRRDEWVDDALTCGGLDDALTGDADLDRLLDAKAQRNAKDAKRSI